MTALLILIYFCFISLGLPDSALGAAWPVMKEFFNVDVSYAGFLSVTISGGTVISALSSMFLQKKLGTGRIIAFSTLATAIALFAFSLTKNFWLLVPLALVLGLGAGSIDSAINNFVALHYKAKHMSFLHGCWGIGAAVGPLIISLFIDKGKWYMGYRTIALIQSGLCLIQFMSIKMFNKTSNGKGTEEERIIGGSRYNTVVFALLAFFFYCSAETSAILWVATYFVSLYNTGPELAARASTALFFGITSGRLISGFVAEKVGVKRLVYIGSVLSGVSAVAIFLNSNVTLAFILVFFTGLGFAPVYPQMIHRTPRRFSSENSPKIIGWQMATAYVGSTAVPPVLGLICKATSFNALPLLIIICAFGVIGCTLIVEKGNKVR